VRFRLYLWLAQYQTALKARCKFYEVLPKANAKNRQPHRDDLIERRESGTLAMFVKERAEAVCKE
jgi:hypothetical protein